MDSKYKLIVKDGQVVDEQYFERVCCGEMRKALLNQETPLGNPNANCLWFYCPFCKEEILYL
mgnify:CR=1 FL=1